MQVSAIECIHERNSLEIIEYRIFVDEIELFSQRKISLERIEIPNRALHLVPPLHLDS